MEIHDGVGALERVERGRPHGFLEQVAGLEQSRGIHEQELGVAVGDEAVDRLARHLGLGTHRGERLADQGVQEGRFSGVRLAGQDDGGEAGHRGNIE